MAAPGGSQSSTSQGKLVFRPKLRVAGAEGKTGSRGRLRGAGERRHAERTGLSAEDRVGRAHRETKVGSHLQNSAQNMERGAARGELPEDQRKRRASKGSAERSWGRVCQMRSGNASAGPKKREHQRCHRRGSQHVVAKGPLFARDPELQEHDAAWAIADKRGYGATVARLTPDQKVGSSNLSALTFFVSKFDKGKCRCLWLMSWSLEGVFTQGKRLESAAASC